MMKEQNRAPLNTQLGNEPCIVDDTSEMFWLRQSDDYQSRFQLGNALAKQYRFKEALEAYKKAARIKRDDWKLYYSMAGAHLTLRHFEEALSGYQRCLELGADRKTVAYPIGVARYLQRDYEGAAELFAQCLPCDDEMAIAVIYWHTLSCHRADREAALLKYYHSDMKVGHHTAYLLAVSVFRGKKSWEQVASELEQEKDDLSYVVAMYGLCGYLEFYGKKRKSERYMNLLLEREEVWPCISYLAAWNDRHWKDRG
jgi:tetratricopeptide (TPR) repeat protein